MNKLLAFFCIIFFVLNLKAMESGNRVIDLNGHWRFEIGDNINYANPEYDDSQWEIIPVPGRWENFGFPGYDGYAWYRKTFHVPTRLKNETLFLFLGKIDDVDMVYLNGKFVNSTGSFPPDYRTAYNVTREYALPPGLLIYGGNNTIAIRVFDYELAGGIIDGDPGIYIDHDNLELKVNLSGIWKFAIGDDPARSYYNYDDSDWDDIMVPGKWEPQGYENYDGYAWYRRKIFWGADLTNDRYILLLGKIDDIDEIYFNGQRIGGTGRFPGEVYCERQNQFWIQDRAYTIPPDLVRWNDQNVIAVRIYDVWLDGGIYQGPVGLVPVQHYLKYQKKQPEKGNLLLKILSRIIDNYSDLIKR